MAPHLLLFAVEAIGLFAVTGTWKKLSLDLRYVDTNLDERECGFTRRCDATVVATLTLRFW